MGKKERWKSEPIIILKMHITLLLLVLWLVKRAETVWQKKNIVLAAVSTYVNCVLTHCSIFTHRTERENENGSICFCNHGQWQYLPHFLFVLRCYFLINFICTLSNLLCLVSLELVRLFLFLCHIDAFQSALFHFHCLGLLCIYT